jgi:hypothetical protein
VTAADVARAKTVEQSLPASSPLRYNLEIVARVMEQYRAASAAATTPAVSTAATTAAPTTPAAAFTAATATAPVLGIPATNIPPTDSSWWANVAATNALTQASRDAMIAAGQNPDK